MSSNKKASKKAKVGPKKNKKTANPDKLRRDLLKVYIGLKKQNPKHEIFREQFMSEAEGFTRHDVDVAYGSYTQLKAIGDNEFFQSLPQRQRALMSERKKIFDPSATQEDVIEDLRAIQEEYDGKYITRNFYRENGKYADSTWSQYFGSFSEFRKGAKLELSRHQQKMERAIAKHASYDHYRKFFHEEVLPHAGLYEINDKKKHPLRTILVGSDIHDIECDRFALAVFIATAKRMQPDIIILNGDIFDLYEFSRWTKDPRHYNIKERFDFVHEHIFGALRAVCPNAQIDFILGNHEYRLLKLLADKTPNVQILLSDVMGLSLNDVFGVHDHRINLISKLDLGAYTTPEMRKEVRQNYKTYYECYMATHEPEKGSGLSGTNGHLHRMIYNTSTNLLRGNISWVQTPALHRRDAHYIQGRNKADLGFLVTTVNVDTKEVIQNPIVMHEDWAVVEGVYYERDKMLKRFADDDKE